MYDTSGSYSVCYAAPTDYNLAGRLNWLRGELARQASRHSAQHAADEWRALRSVTLGRALTNAEAYASFGTLLGLFPPLALFARMLGFAYWRGAEDGLLLWGAFFLAMNAVCCFVGRKMGRFVGRKFCEPRPRSLPLLLLCSVLMAVLWGLVTGAAGGAICFLVGSVLGVACAVPVSLAAFPVFAVLHRAISGDGMIEARKLWPLACGVTLTAAALILSPWVW